MVLEMAHEGPSKIHGDRVHRLEIVGTLALLALNVLLQRHHALSNMLQLEPATYRILRTLPFVAAFDAIVCLVILVWCSIKGLLCRFRGQTKIQNLAVKERDFESEVTEKENMTVPLRTWNRQRFRPLRQVPLFLIAALRLMKLSTSRGIYFSNLIGWAFLVSYVSNELLSRNYSDVISNDRTLLPTTLVATAVPGSALASKRLKSTMVAFLICSLLLEVVHISWLGQYLVPRTLWMDWGPPQINPLTKESYHFDVPAGAWSPALNSNHTAESLHVVGFWPSHSLSGSVFYFIASLLCYTASLSILLPMVLLPAFIGCFWFCSTVISLFGLSIYCREMSEHWNTGFAKRCSTQISRKINMVLNLLLIMMKKQPLSTRISMRVQTICHKVVCFLLLILCLMVLSTLALGIMVGLDPVVRFITEHFVPESAIKSLLYVLQSGEDEPETSYAVMIGSLFVLFTLAFQRWLIPFIFKIDRDNVPAKIIQYWTSLWISTVLYILSLVYYLFYFDTAGTYAPGWSKSLEILSFGTKTTIYR